MFELSVKIKDKCEEKGITVNKMLQDCDLNKSLMYTIKNGKIPSVDKIIRIADYLHVSIDELVGRKVSAPSVTQNGMYQLTDEEFDLVDAYRDSTEEDKQFIMNVAKVSQVKGNTMFVSGVLDNLHEALKEEKKEAVL